MTKSAVQNAVENPCDAPPSNQCLSSEINAKREIIEHHVKFPCC